MKEESSTHSFHIIQLKNWSGILRLITVWRLVYFWLNTDETIDLYFMHICIYTENFNLLVLHARWLSVALPDTTALVWARMVDMCHNVAVSFNREQKQTHKPSVYGNITYHPWKLEYWAVRVVLIYSSSVYDSIPISSPLFNHVFLYYN